MNSRQERRLTTFRRVHEFLADHPPTDPAPANFTRQLGILKELIESLSQRAVDQDASQRLGMQETRRVAALRQRIIVEHMVPVTRIARALLPDAPGIEAALTTPHSWVRTQTLATAANAMAEAVTPYAEVFVESGRPADFIEQLRALARELTGMVDGKGAIKGRRRAATGSVPKQIAQAARVIRLLNAIVDPFYRRDPHTFTGWKDARRMRKFPSPSGGSVVEGGSETTGGDGGAPVSSEVQEEVQAAPAPELKVA